LPASQKATQPFRQAESKPAKHASQGNRPASQQEQTDIQPAIPTSQLDSKLIQPARHPNKHSKPSKPAGKSSQPDSLNSKTAIQKAKQTASNPSQP
jgi:hypothetical protein